MRPPRLPPCSPCLPVMLLLIVCACVHVCVRACAPGPNLVVSGCPHPHAEDTWQTVTIGGTTLRVTGPCPRCTVPDVAQQSGTVDTREIGPMRTLRGYRSRAGVGVAFGVYLRPETPGASVRVGDAVTVVPFA